MTQGLIHRQDSCLFVVDVQEKLAPAIEGGEAAIEVISRLVQASEKLQVPVIASEQYVKGLGATVPQLAQWIGADQTHEKIHFNGLNEPGLAGHLKALGRTQVVLVGMETHVCVMQTAAGLLEAGYQVFVVADGVGSRHEENRELGLARMAALGAQVVSSEMVLFEWLGQAGTPDFKSILPLIK